MHTYAEVEEWFRDAGLVDLVRGSFPVSVSGRRPAAGDRAKAVSFRRWPDRSPLRAKSAAAAPRKGLGFRPSKSERSVEFSVTG